MNLTERYAHLAECALLEDFGTPPPGIETELHALALYLHADLTALYSIELDSHTVTRWLLWLFDVKMAAFDTWQGRRQMLHRQLNGDEPSVQEQQAHPRLMAASQEADWAVAWKRDEVDADPDVAEKTKEEMREALFVCARGEYP